MENNNADIVVAGHVCLDITPVFPDVKIDKVNELLIPGRLIQMGKADIHIGGSVANTGLGLKVLGADVSLMGKVGDDDFGTVVLSQIEHYASKEGMIVSKGENTSYSIVIAPQGIDRIFLHHSGANNTFCSEDLNYDIIKEAKMFHFGYPPLMRTLYQNDGEELVKIFKKVKEFGVATSLDMAAVDANSESGQVDWANIIQRVLPYVDFFVPSVEELAFMIDRPRYQEWVQRADGRDLTAFLSIEEDVAPLANKLLEWGAKVVIIKCGAPGIFFATAEEKVLTQISSKLEMDYVNWGNRKHFELSYKPDRMLSGTGAGDTSIAAFLYAVFLGYPWEECLQYATATGASCVTEYDAISGLKSFAEIKEKIQNGWEKQNLFL